MTFTLEIRCDNAAFSDDEAVLGASWALADELGRIMAEIPAALATKTSGSLRDANGNSVGHWMLSD